MLGVSAWSFFVPPSWPLIPMWPPPPKRCSFQCVPVPCAALSFRLFLVPLASLSEVLPSQNARSLGTPSTTLLSPPHCSLHHIAPSTTLLHHPLFHPLASHLSCQIIIPRCPVLALLLVTSGPTTCHINAPIFQRSLCSFHSSSTKLCYSGSFSRTMCSTISLRLFLCDHAGCSVILVASAIDIVSASDRQDIELLAADTCWLRAGAWSSGRNVTVMSGAGEKRAVFCSVT